MLGVLLNGCFMAPMALLGPITSGYSTASLIQSGVSMSANYLVKKSSGKSITQHAYDAINVSIIKQSYFPENKTHAQTSPKLKTLQIHKN